MFALRFELRQYQRSGQQFKLIDSVTTDPFTVVSHSTQLKPSYKNLPVVTEVIPYIGPPTGSTRVAILGVNFQDSPTTRVRFDNIEVIPIFHGAKTLLCHTPKHEPGVVNVFVCNEPNAWSQNAGTFTYDEHDSSLSGSGQFKVPHAFQSANSPPHDSVSSGNLFDSFGAPKLSNSQAMEFDFGSSGFFPNKHDSRGYALIHCIAASGDLDAMRAFAATPGADPLLSDKCGNTALHWSVRYGHFTMSQALIHSARTLVTRCNNDGESPLHWAVRRGDDDVALKLALLLIQCGAQVNAQDASGITPLHLAVVDGHARMTQLLLQCNADHALTESGDGLNAVHLAAIYNRPSVLRALAQYGCSFNSRDDEGDTPLHWAHRFKHEQLAVLLVTLGALSSVLNVDGETPQDLSADILAPSNVEIRPSLKMFFTVEHSTSPFYQAPRQQQCIPAPSFGRAYVPFGVFVQ